MQHLSIWEKESFFKAQDVIIIGSGFTGLWSAFHMITQHPHYKITVLERGIIPTGASSRNAGFSCFGSPSEILSDAKEMGEAAMWELVALRFAGLQEIRNHFTDDEIGYDGNGGYECFTNQSKEWQESYDKLEWLNEGLAPITGFENTFEMADEKLTLFGFNGFEHLIENKLEAGIHSGKLLTALLRKVQSLGVQVFTGMEVVSYFKAGENIIVNTKQDFTFNTKQLLLCTNAFTKQLFPEADIIPCRGQVLVTSSIPNWKMKGTFHFDRGYYYFRNLGDRLLIGGARNKAFEEESTIEMNITATIQEELEDFTRKYLLPGIAFTITDRWSGIMAMGNEKLPIVSKISDGVFCCARMSGMGVALAPVAAKQVFNLMTG